MSRLYDRIMLHGCRPLTARDVYDATTAGAAGLVATQEEIARRSGRPPTDDELAAAIASTRQRLAGDRATDVVTSAELASAVVVSAEEVADYVATFPAGTDTTSFLDSVVPPFSTLLVEFQERPNVLGLSSWGVLFWSEDLRDVEADDRGWQLTAALVGEWKKQEPVGPIVRWIMGLDALGRAMSPSETDGWAHGYGTYFAAPPEIPGLPSVAAFEFADALASLLAPALLAISLMHCKNVDLRPVDPPERVSKRHERKTGQPLTRYHVLEIAPMRRILDTEGEAQTKGLSHALHICRGHFKTFTEDAPLFGKRVGTYWWPAHLRGSPEEGAVEKDYRIRLDADGIGQTYREANEDATVASAQERADDPDTSERGLRAHNRTQNLLAAAVTDAGLSPLSPRADEPDFDLAWLDGGTLWVAEVKSTTAKNEERQMRLAIGQVIRYRERLSGEGTHAQAMIAVENAPFDESWIDLCGREGIALVWPEVMAQAIGKVD